jgi:hypothetical protein
MPTAIDATVRHGYERMAGDFQRVFGERFVALVASPSGAAAAFVASLRADDLHALGPLADAWRRESAAVPLVMTPDEFRRSLDTFPLEYQSLLDDHVVIAGHPPFEGVQIQQGDLRRACEAQARGHLIHLRQGWIGQASHHSHHVGLAHLLVDSAGPLRATLANLARLHGETALEDGALATWAHRTIGMPDALVRNVLSLTDAPHRSAALVASMPEYLEACERLWAFTDNWRATGGASPPSDTHR